jgi:hypothetical protein
MDSDNLKNSKWISWTELAQRWKVRDFELIEYLGEDLQPYSENGSSLSCPSACHAYRRLSDELSYIRSSLELWENHLSIGDMADDVLPRDVGQVRSPEEIEDEKRKLKERRDQILAEMGIIGEADLNLTSWKYFEAKLLDDNFEEVLGDLRCAFFEVEEVQKVELILDLGPKKLSRGGKVRKQVRALAKKMLAEDPAAKKADVIKKAKELKITIKPGTRPGENKNYSYRQVSNMLDRLPFENPPSKPESKK